MQKTVGALGAVLAGCAALVVALGQPALSQQPPPDPPGNNGTIKVDGGDFDDHPDNEPHVGCVFQIDFYNYDEGDDLFASVIFEGQPPTGGGVLLTDSVFIGEDPAGGGDDDLDASVTYDLSQALAGIEPHPVQGHHVMLTIEADGSIGDDTKHKVFWVEGCVPPTPPTPPGPPVPPPSPTPPVPPPPPGGVRAPPAAVAVPAQPTFAG